MLGMCSMDMNKINIIQPTPKIACECFGATCSYCKHEPPHPSPVHSDWSNEDWDSEKAKAREQKSFTDFKPPKPQTDEQVTDSVNKIPFQNLTIQDKPEEELPEVTNTLVPPPEMTAAAPAMDVTESEDIMEETNKELTDQNKGLQKEELYAIYISMLSNEEESDTDMDTDETSYPFFS